MNPLPELLGSASALAAVRDDLGRLLRQTTGSSRLPCILLLGETGTGKGLLARALHRASPRGAGAFVDVDCAAIPETLLEAELFGFERGAFTDARQAKPGLFQAAHGGTIFFDEVGLLPRVLQAKLVKTIEERVVRRLGSTRGEHVDVWVMSATNENLLEAIRDGRFRQDLYHRLAGLPLELPPLRERGQDILLLAESYLARACAEYRLTAKHLTADAKAALLAHPWPGNVRELINVTERVALLAEGPAVTGADLGLDSVPGAPARGADGRPMASALKRERIRLERDRIIEALRASEWNVSQAAARLGIPRSTLQYGMQKHGLARETRSLRVRAPDAADSAAPMARPPASAPEVVPPLGAAGRRLSPFLGRKRELALLGERLRLCRAGRGQVLGIAGEPGVGKSRLLSEFRESAAAREVDYLEGRCLSNGSSIPYLPILDLLRRDWHIADRDTPSVIEAKLRRRLEDLGMDPATTAPYLLWLLGVRNGVDRISHLSPEDLKRRALEALRGLLLERSRRGALILALEDLHWIDKASEEFLGSLLDAVSGASILFLATYRPGYRPPWIERSYVTQLALPLLSAHDSTAVVRSLLSENQVPDQVVGSIVARADGNPFFLEQLAQALAVDPGLGSP